MPPRRTHKKSRAGCQRCKLRKIKCDEVHPNCGNCSKHGVICDFSDPAVPASPVRFRAESRGRSSMKSSAPTTPFTPHTPGPTTPAPISIYRPSEEKAIFSRYAASSRTMEMRLLHQYTAATAKTLAMGSSTTVDAWQIGVPELAFDCPCLMDALLAVAALHLRSSNPDDKSLARASHGYMASAISQYSAVLMKGVDDSNAEAIFTTSALIAFQASASRRFMEDDRVSMNADTQYTPPLQWFHSFQGVKAIVFACWKWLRFSERVKPIINAQPALALDMNPDRPQFFGMLLEGLDEQLEQLDESRRLETRQAYEHSVAYLNWSHQKPERARISGFPATVSRRYVELLEEHDPRALIIMASFFAMTKVVDDVWWLQDVAKPEVAGVMSLLPREWWGKMDWALRVTDHEGMMDEITWGDGWHAEDPEQADLHSHIEILTQLSPPCDQPLKVVV